MKVASKPISSPSRAAEKFPPPLMRFLRSNVGSKSRGRLRSSPMFVVRKKNAAIETQEPSSPKVTCIGQVRVKRSSKKKNFARSKSGRSKPSPATCLCFAVPKSCLFCTPRKPKFLPILRRWVSFFRFGLCEKTDFRDDSSKLESNRRNHFNDGETEVNNENGDEDEEPRIVEPAEVFTASTPPKNAFLLTRCRSAPFRSSSLAVRFWGETEKGEDDEVKKSCDFDEGESETEKQFASISEPDNRKSRIDEESDEISVIRKQLEGSINGKNMEKLDMPLVLTRCKSEPARRGEQFLEPNKVLFCD